MRGGRGIYWIEVFVGGAFIKSIWHLLGVEGVSIKVKGVFYIFFLTRG